MVVFLLLARQWPKLMEEWSEVDRIMERNYGYPKYLDRRLKITAFVLIALAVGKTRYLKATNNTKLLLLL